MVFLNTFTFFFFLDFDHQEELNSKILKNSLRAILTNLYENDKTKIPGYLNLNSIIYILLDKYIVYAIYYIKHELYSCISIFKNILKTK